MFLFNPLDKNAKPPLKTNTSFTPNNPTTGILQNSFNSSSNNNTNVYQQQQLFSISNSNSATKNSMLDQVSASEIYYSELLESISNKPVPDLKPSNSLQNPLFYNKGLQNSLNHLGL
ncbi:hypothetical protein AYI69_g1777 [Smittium culicis]|uniref:Uncharacterized protein n=1 Tax=Smittium culicis TaxID=133412 RepID=A0A1R1YPH5_9FUNG|nr:hypothetical protein AYI69_g6816 [Smittium culicis]OMJ28735.1 hypothetical protein AYI69_g1777 [Smittium culicis]